MVVRRRRTAVFYFACLSIGTGWAACPGASADEVARPETSRSELRGTLARLPSPPGPHIAALKNLPENAWLDLGRPAPDPQWGRVRGRSWTTNMAFAPSLQGAFLFGEGVHGWHNAATGRYMDDLWLYDVMAHRWVNLYPGTNIKNPPRLIVNRDGFVAASDGTPIPIATMVHGYQMTAWDPATRRFMAMPNRHGYYKRVLPDIARFMVENRNRINFQNASPWFFDIKLGRWDRRPTPLFAPPSGHGDTLIYVPSLNRSLFRHHDRIWFYEGRGNRWIPAGPPGPKPPFGIDPTAGYDPKRDRIYIGGGSYPVASGPNALWIYDIKGDRWLDPRPSGTSIGNSYNTNIAMLHCDLANDMVLLFRHNGAERGIFAYDPEDNAWEVVPTGFPSEWPADGRAGGSSGFYHPGLGLHVFHVAGDSRDNGRILVFRYGPPQR